MKILSLLLEIIKNPNAIKHYRDLQREYQNMGKIYEAEAIGHLIIIKFNKF